MVVILISSFVTCYLTFWSIFLLISFSFLIILDLKPCQIFPSIWSFCFVYNFFFFCHTKILKVSKVNQVFYLMICTFPYLISRNFFPICTFKNIFTFSLKSYEFFFNGPNPKTWLLSPILFINQFFQNIEWSSLCYIACHRCLSLLHIVVCAC